MEQRNQEIQIKLNEETAKGIYSNATIISHTQTEFLLDFVTIFHGKGVLSSRMILSPNHAKSLLRVLSENVAAFENKFGEIKDLGESKLNLSEVH